MSDHLDNANQPQSEVTDVCDSHSVPDQPESTAVVEWKSDDEKEVAQPEAEKEGDRLNLSDISLTGLFGTEGDEPAELPPKQPQGEKEVEVAHQIAEAVLEAQPPSQHDLQVIEVQMTPRTEIIVKMTDNETAADDHAVAEGQGRDSKVTVCHISASDNNIVLAKGTQNPDFRNKTQQTEKRNLETKDNSSNTHTVVKDKKCETGQQTMPNLKQRQMELHRMRMAVEEKRLELFELKIQREKQEMSQAQAIFEKTLQLKLAELSKLQTENNNGTIV